jgi:hypothetical protein
VHLYIKKNTVNKILEYKKWQRWNKRAENVTFEKKSLPISVWCEVVMMISVLQIV